MLFAGLLRVFPVKPHVLTRISLVLSSMMSRRNIGRFAQYDSQTLRVLVDMDQVLADFEGHFLTKFREQFPDEPFINLDDREGFYIRDQYAKMKPGLADKVREIYCTENFFLDLEEIEGSVAAVKEMSQIENVDVFICTSPIIQFRYCVKEKFQWVEEHLGQEWLERLILARDKTLVNGHLLIDDRPNITGCCLPPAWEHIVFTAVHNTKTELRGKRRLNNWVDGSWRELIEDFKKRI